MSRKLSEIIDRYSFGVCVWGGGGGGEGVRGMEGVVDGVEIWGRQMLIYMF